MKDICKLSSNFFLILLNLFIISIISSSQYEIEDEFTHVDFYESFSAPKECFHIYHNNPIGPKFLLADIQYLYTSKATQRIIKTVSKKYQLQLINKRCEVSIKIPILGKVYSKMNFEYRFYLYYQEKDMAISIYDFYEDFQPLPLITIDTKNNFGLSVEFSHTADQNSFEYDPELPVVRSYLLSLSKNIDTLCVITENNDKMILWHDNLLKKNNLITRIRVDYLKNGEVTFTKDYPAFECTEDEKNLIQTVFLIYEGNDFKIRLSYVYWEIDTVHSFYYMLTAHFFNIDYVNILDKRKLPKKAIKLFSLITRSNYVECPNDDTTTLLTSNLGYTYRATLEKEVVVSKGVHRIKMYYPSTIYPCIQ